MIWRAVTVVGAWVFAVGCATAPPSPREDTRALRPGAEVAEEVGEATEALLEREGQARVRYASSSSPEGEAKPAKKDDAKEPGEAKEPAPGAEPGADDAEGEGEGEVEVEVEAPEAP